MSPGSEAMLTELASGKPSAPGPGGRLCKTVNGQQSMDIDCCSPLSQPWPRCSLASALQLSTPTPPTPPTMHTHKVPVALPPPPRCLKHRRSLSCLCCRRHCLQQRHGRCRALSSSALAPPACWPRAHRHQPGAMNRTAGPQREHAGRVNSACAISSSAASPTHHLWPQ